MEIWKDIKRYEGLYQISDLGRIKTLDKKVRNKIRGKWGYSIRKEKVMKIKITKRKGAEGYHEITLRKNGKPTSFMVHRLVGLNFIPNPDNKEEVNHKFGIRGDNRASQLEWMTKKENMKHAFDRGSWSNMDNPVKGVLCKWAKLTDEKVIKIRDEYELGKISTRKLAEKYNISHSIMWGVVTRKRWAHVK